jgi:RNA polymerase sigma-70 factor (sigma-E family)
MQETGFEDFVRQSLPALGRYAYVLTGSRHQAEDLVQDTLVRVGTAWGRVSREGSPHAYARTAMVRLHVSGWRWRRRRTRLPDGYIDPGREDPALSRVEHRSQLRPLLNTLTPLQRAVVVLGYFDDLDDAGIAEVINRKPATVRSLRRRALTTLRAGLDSQEDTHDEPAGRRTMRRRS